MRSPDDILLILLNSQSFLSLWFWVFVAFIWAQMTHFTLNIGHHDTRHASRSGGQVMVDYEQLVYINLRNNLRLLRRYGPLVVGFMAFAMSLFAVLGFGYGFELMQALALQWFFISILGVVSWRFLLRLEEHAPKGKELTRLFTRHTMLKQVIGFIAILVTAIYGVIYAALKLGLWVQQI